MKKAIAVLPGDGVGPEVTAEGVKVLTQVAKKFGHKFTFTEGLIGAVAIDKTGSPFPPETQTLCESSDAILFGAIGDPKYDHNPKAKIRPEQGLLKMRKSLGLYANVRPIFTFENMLSISTLKAEIIKGVDFIVLRELTGGSYYGEPRGRSEDGETAFETCIYSKKEIERIGKFGFDLALKRRKKLTVVDKANVLPTSQLWREVIQNMSRSYPQVTVDYIFVDIAAMYIVKKPREFDVILTENMFGDILSDEASVITGSLGMLPSASIGQKTSLYEPVHGSFPRAKGLNIANPLGSILSVSLMLDYTFGLLQESQAVKNAVNNALLHGFGTQDFVKQSSLTTSQLGTKICEFL